MTLNANLNNILILIILVFMLAYAWLFYSQHKSIKILSKTNWHQTNINDGVRNIISENSEDIHTLSMNQLDQEQMDELIEETNKLIKASKDMRQAYADLQAQHIKLQQAYADLVKEVK